MGRLPSTRHELFARGLAKGEGTTDAYTGAGYKESPAAASRLSKDVKICQRVEELKKEQLDGDRLDWSWVKIRLMDKAENAKSEAVAVRALELLGKTIGIFREGADQPAPASQTDRTNVVDVDFNKMARK